MFLLNAFKHNLYLSQVGRLEKFLCIEIRVVVLFLNLSHFCHLPTGVLRKTQDNQTFTKGQFGQTELKTMQLFTQEKYTAVHCNQWASLRFYGQ